MRNQRHRHSANRPIWLEGFQRVCAMALATCSLLVVVACGGGEGNDNRDGALGLAGQKQALADSPPRQIRHRRLFGQGSTHESRDFNGDGKADLLWYDTASRATATWLMNGASRMGGGDILNHPSFRVVGTGDFNGDGQTDLIWHDAVGDETTMWLVQDGRAMQGRSLLSGTSRVAPIGAPDLDGDGKSDLLWWDRSTGATHAWLMDGSSVKVAETLLVHPGFRVVAMPDLNGDGRTDLIWHDPNSGQTIAWLMNGLSHMAGAVLLTHPAFKVSMTPDLDGDGRSDLLWRDDETGQTVAWLMNGLQFTGGRELIADKSYRVVDTPDLTGDGRSDLLWFNASTGDTVAWIMNGTTLVGGGTLLRDSQYVPVATDDFNGDGRADILWYAELTRTTVAWISGELGYQGVTLLTGSPYMPASLFQARAAGFPTKAITIIVPFAAGGVTDKAARDLAEAIKEEFGHSVLIDNRGGDAGSVGSAVAARATPDGHTLLLGTVGTHAINAALYPTLSYDPINDFTPVTRVANVPHVLVAHPARPFTTLPQLIADARSNPGAIYYGSAGTGTMTHLAGELFESMANLDLGHLPYRGSGPMVTDLLGNQFPIAFLEIPSALSQVSSGRLRPLGVTGARRAASMPEVPTIAEAGVAGYEAGFWSGLLVPVGTPQPVVVKLHDMIVKALGNTGLRARFATTNTEVVHETPEQFADFIRAESAKWGRVVKASDINR